MSNRIAKAFSNGKVFIPFITCGDPNLETTEKIVLAMEKAGADIIELGIPFSDPTAEGPVIQAGNMRALSAGMTTAKIMEFVRNLRKKTDIALVFMTYANVVYSYEGTTTAMDRKGISGTYGRDTDAILSGSKKPIPENCGTEKFIKEAAEAGIDGLILPDVPHEEGKEFSSVAEKYGVDYISLISPTSENRIGMVARDATGFVYIVSSLGVTGERSRITTDIEKMVRLVKETKDIPCAVGFGISTPEQAKEMASFSDGAIVGSAIVRMIAEKGENAVSDIADYVKKMKEAVKEA